MEYICSGKKLVVKWMVNALEDLPSDKRILFYKGKDLENHLSPLLF